MLTFRSTAPIRVAGRVLLLVCSYRGGIGNPPPWSVARRFPRLGPLGWLADRATLLPLRRFIAGNRDFFANPRDLAYQLGLARDLLALGTAGEVVCVLDRAFEAAPETREFESLGRVEVREAAEMGRGATGFETVVLIYPDALGLGWGGLEASLRKQRHSHVVFVNGRRRAMALDAAARWALVWRRMLAVTRLPELVFSALIVPVAACCAAADALRGRS